MTGAIAITADAFNNLSDAASSLVTMIGFKLASNKADSEHPFGHGRIEYISGVIVSFLILLMAYELPSLQSVCTTIQREETRRNRERNILY